MTSEAMQELIKSLAPAVAAQLLAQAKSAPSDMAALFGGKSAAPEPTPSVLKSDAAFGAFVKAVHAAGRRPSREVLIEAAKGFGGADVQKAIQESKFDSAGVLVPVQQSGELIEFLRPTAVLMQLGVRTIQFKSEMHMGKQTGTATFRWIGEGDTVPRSDIKYGKIVLKAHKAMVLVDLSNDLLRNPSVGDAGVGQDIRETMADGLDDAGINGDGQGPNPKGLLRQIDPANRVKAAGTSPANYIADIDNAIERVTSSHIRLSRPGWLLHPTREAALLGLRDNAGWVFRTEMLDRKTIRGFPYVASTRIDAARMVFGTWDQFLYGVDQDVIISEHDTRAEYDETTLRAILRADFKVRQPKAFIEISY
jgi:HK97 family phage major capsid protein